jgi:hypothetical protein
VVIVYDGFERAHSILDRFISISPVDGVCLLVFLLKKDVKFLLRLLPEWGQEFLCLHLVLLNREVVVPGYSLFSQRSLQSNSSTWGFLRSVQPSKLHAASLTFCRFPIDDVELPVGTLYLY